jgi:hypothetical protein
VENRRAYPQAHLAPLASKAASGLSELEGPIARPLARLLLGLLLPSFIFPTGGPTIKDSKTADVQDDTTKSKKNE